MQNVVHVGRHQQCVADSVLSDETQGVITTPTAHQNRRHAQNSTSQQPEDSTTDEAELGCYQADVMAIHALT
ncbi:hypothetical protein D9M68_710310 [compost metagenome]